MPPRPSFISRPIRACRQKVNPSRDPVPLTIVVDPQCFDDKPQLQQVSGDSFHAQTVKRLTINSCLVLTAFFCN